MLADTETLLIWLGILLCLSQSAAMSGLNVAIFSIGKLRLLVEAANGSEGARRILDLKKNENELLTTIIWANVSWNVLLTLLSGSALAGVAAFVFSTVAITMFAEVLPQAFFLRNALRVVPILTPLLEFYRIVLWPVAKPSALLLDRLLGKASSFWLKEDETQQAIAVLMDLHDITGIDRLEGLGAINFLRLDDQPITEIGSPLRPETVIPMAFENDRPLPPGASDPDAWRAFLRKLRPAARYQAVLTDLDGTPRSILDAQAFLAAQFDGPDEDVAADCHRPVMVTDASLSIAAAIEQAHRQRGSERELCTILLWGDSRRIITPYDLLDQLLIGI